MGFDGIQQILTERIIGYKEIEVSYIYTVQGTVNTVFSVGFDAEDGSKGHGNNQHQNHNAHERAFFVADIRLKQSKDIHTAPHHCMEESHALTWVSLLLSSSGL